jgi:hypothetical protein
VIVIGCGFLVARCVCIAWWGAHQERGAKNSKDVAGRRKVKPCPNIPVRHSLLFYVLRPEVPECHLSRASQRSRF